MGIYLKTLARTGVFLTCLYLSTWGRGDLVHIITEQLNHDKVYGGMHLQTCFFTLFVLFTYSQRTKWCTFKCEEFKTVKYGNYHSKKNVLHAYKNSINKGYCREMNESCIQHKALGNISKWHALYLNTVSGCT